MFERIKKMFSGPAEMAASQRDSSRVSEWAGTQGFSFSSQSGHTSFALDGRVRNRRWRLECGRSTRDFISGNELRARAELGVDPRPAVVVMNRALKDALEKRAYQLYTDSVQTTADPNLPEEMRWLAVYEEFAWSGLPAEFWARYAVLADTREHAQSWIDQALSERLMQWPHPAPSAGIAFMLMLMRGKAYLRMEFFPEEITTLQHASSIFTLACESALRAFEEKLKR